MLTLPVEAGSAVADRPARIPIIGQSETVLSELVTRLRERGYAAGATNEFDRTLDLFDAGRAQPRRFPRSDRRTLRNTSEKISTQNPAVALFWTRNSPPSAHRRDPG